MCYPDGAMPPELPRALVSERASDDVDGHDITLTAADGAVFGAYFAHPAVESTIGVVILPDVRGLHDFYRGLATQFARAGFHAVAIDYFGRSAGVGARSDEFPYRDHMATLTPEQTDLDVAAAVSALRDLDGSGIRSIVTVGFCLGGGLSWRQSATNPDVAGCIGFYGVPARVEDVVDRMQKPILMLVAGADMTPQTAFEDFDRRLTERGVEHKVVVYDGAPHSFFDRHSDEWREACEDSWKQMLSFISSVREH